MRDGPERDPAWPRVRRAVLERDGYRCQIRGPHCRGRATEVDHIIPWRDGGAWLDPANLRAACSWCNTWRANRQKRDIGWRRSPTQITLVVGPPGACELLAEYVRQHAGPRDLVVDYRALAAAIGERPAEIRRLRGSLLTRVRRGEVDAPRVWITSTNPRAEATHPHHEVVVIDPGREAAEAGAPGLEYLVAEWYRVREAKTTTQREW